MFDYSVCGISELLDILCEAGRLDAETAGKVRKFISSTSPASVPEKVPETVDNGHQPSKKRKKVWLSSATTTGLEIYGISSYRIFSIATKMLI